MNDSGLDINTAFLLGPLEITSTVTTTWAIMLVLGLFSWFSTRHLSQSPGAIQTMLEAIITIIQNSVASVAPQQARQLTPFIGSLWIFLVIANLSGLIPGVHSPTRDLSATAALAIIVFLSVHWYGIRIQGFKKYLLHYLSPSPILLPFYLISEITRTVALAVRLFGNIMSLEMAALLILLVASFLAPVPILMLHIIEALVQAYIFGMLALVYVASGIQSHQVQQNNNEE
ncbi:MAG: F0F1 ATP synthase subunit A [Gammaproteobacteria bacterium]